MGIEIIISAVAITVSVATLTVLVYQTRALIRSIRANIYNQIVQQNLRLNEVLVSNSQIARILSNKIDLGSVSESDLSVAKTLASSFINHYENVYIQHKLTNLPETVWPGWETYMHNRILESPLMSEVWREMKPVMDKDFVAYVEKRERLRSS